MAFGPTAKWELVSPPSGFFHTTRPEGSSTASINRVVAIYAVFRTTHASLISVPARIVQARRNGGFGRDAKVAATTKQSMPALSATLHASAPAGARVER